MSRSASLAEAVPVRRTRASDQGGARSSAPLVYGILQEAFAEDPFLRWMFADPARYERAFTKLASAFGKPGFASGSVDVDMEGRTAALWLPPGQDTSITTLVGSVVTGVRARQWPVLARVLLAMLRSKPREPHWYLAMIGTRSSARGAGLGSALLRDALRRCDRDGRAAYLEATSEQNVALYERHGFRKLPEIRIGDAPPLQPMIRHPQPIVSGKGWGPVKS